MVQLANSNSPVPDEITLIPPSFRYPRLSTLTSGSIVIDDAVSINGPGAQNLQVTANLKSRLFSSTKAGAIDWLVRGMTLTGGSANDGGAVYAFDDRVDNCGLYTHSQSSLLWRCSR